jgi:hypothetical protein
LVQKKSKAGENPFSTALRDQGKFDPGWCRTDLGGPNAPNAPESSLPGVIVGAFVDDKKSGRCFGASNFYGMTLEQAVEHAEKSIPVYIGSLE